MTIRTSTFRAINKTKSSCSFRSLHNTLNLSATPTTESTSSSSGPPSTSNSPPPPPKIRVASVAKQIRITSKNSLKLHPKFGKNQNLPIDNEFKERLKRLLYNFQAPIRYAIAYGSGVFPQKGYDEKVNCYNIRYSLLKREGSINDFH